MVDPKMMIRTVILITAATCPILWWLTRHTDDVPGEDWWSFWFLLAFPFCLEAGIRLEKSRFMALAGACVVVAYLSRVAATVLGYMADTTNLQLGRVLIVVVSWSLLALFASFIFYWAARLFVGREK